MPLLFDDVLKQLVSSRAIVRSAMDGVEYAPLEDRIKNGHMMLDLARAAVAKGTTRPAMNHPVDPRIALAAAVALACGWVAMQEWLSLMFDLHDEDPAEVNRQVRDMYVYVADLVFPPSDSEPTV